jgi:hypothetical protein
VQDDPTDHHLPCVSSPISSNLVNAYVNIRCWDGKNLDSPDHQSHVAYGNQGGASGGGACPSTHPVKLPQIMYELMWNVTTFADKSMWPTDGSNPFVYSMNLG